MKDYEDMSDFQINKMVAMTIEGVDFDNAGNAKYAVDCFIKSMDGESVNVLWSGNEEYSFFNPCNNPSDMWPLIVENGISVYKMIDGKSWFATKQDYLLNVHGKYFIDKNPLRAAAIVFLMLNEKD